YNTIYLYDKICHLFLLFAYQSSSPAQYSSVLVKFHFFLLLVADVLQTNWFLKSITLQKLVSRMQNFAKEERTTK
ncbi:hypothetical protein VIGAN_07167500, partial [Vigna angularis var. angularis]